MEICIGKIVGREWDLNPRPSISNFLAKDSNPLSHNIYGWLTVWQIRSLAMTAKLGHFARQAQPYINIDLMLVIFCSKRTSLFLSGASRQTVTILL